MAEPAVPTLRYFDLSGFGGLSGRGGAIRFYMLCNGTKFQEEKVDFQEWGSKLKAEAIKSGESPSGHLPVLHMDGINLFEHLAVLRLLAKQAGQYSKDAMQDYLADSLADAAADFRTASLKAFFSGAPEEKQAYITSPDQRAHFYQLINTLLERCGAAGPHAVGNSSSFADAVLFSVLWDDACMHGQDEKLLTANHKLASFYKAYMSLEPVLAWCKGNRQELCGQAEPHDPKQLSK